MAHLLPEQPCHSIGPPLRRWAGRLSRLSTLKLGTRQGPSMRDLTKDRAKSAQLIAAIAIPDQAPAREARRRAELRGPQWVAPLLASSECCSAATAASPGSAL